MRLDDHRTTWLKAAIADAERRGLPELKPLLEALAQPTTGAAGLRRFGGQATWPDRRIDTTSARRLRARELTVGERRRRVPAADRGGQPAPERVHPGDGRRGAPAGARSRPRARRRATTAGRCTACRSRSRICFDVRGHCRRPRRRASAKGTSPSDDAPVIARLRRAGAVFVGKTNLHEFAFGTTNEDSAFGPARNPLDDTRSPGGSSGGSAASVAAGMALATLGTDTGGSIRIPAAACGLVGLKPALRRGAGDGVVPLSRTLDHVGPLAATVTDAWHVLHALRDRAPVKPLAATPVARPAARGAATVLLRSAGRRRAGAIRGGGRATANGRARRSSTSTFRTRRSSPPIYLHIVFGDAAAYHADTLDTMPERYTPERAAAARDGPLRHGRGLRARARRATHAGAAKSTRRSSGVDALLLPTLPIVAPPIGAATRAGRGHRASRSAT